MFFGSSIAYCDVIPPVIYEETGYSSYVLAGPEQTLPMTYYYIKEMYRTQNPALVFVEVTGAFYPQYTNFTKVNIGYMPWSINRLAATFRTAEQEERMGLLLPFYNYHERWAELDIDDIITSPDKLAGYALLYESLQLIAPKTRAVEFDKDVYESNIDYLRKTVRLCREKGSRVIFFTAPTYSPWEHGYMSMLENELMSIDGADYTNFNSILDELAFDKERDFFDPLHFNIYGAEKFTVFMAEYIKGYRIAKKDLDTAFWDERVSYYRYLLQQ